AAGAAGLVGRFSLAGPAEAAAPPQVSSGTDLVTLGKTGIQTTVLGIGTGTRGGREQRELGQAAFTRLVRHAFDRGLRYIDTADMYMTHLLVRFALKELPREEIFIQTKTRAKHPEVAKADIERFRRELRTSYIDSLLIHAMFDKGWPDQMRAVMDVLLEAREKGRLRAIGVSCHGMDPLVDAVECEWNQVHLVRINPFGEKMDGAPEEVAGQIKKMHEQGRGVIGMKIYGETGFDSPEKRLQSLRFVLGLGTVHAFTIGFTSPQQIDETLELIEKAIQLNKQEAAA
ncbi:MAG TPA: aldo/keto reductase, partial [Planctomycetes bacterium]|nr:aldo/keto reductase [Planctomycetota bacterium]